MSKILYELIDPSGKSILYNNNNLHELENFLQDKNITVRLDLHGVLDLIDENIKFDNYENICCISFVGFNSNIRTVARNTILKRIGKQINFGILLFARGRNNNKNTFTVIGSKAHINSIIPINKKSIFIDDSEDHYKSTLHLQIPNLDAYLFKKNDKFYELIKSYL